MIDFPGATCENTKFSLWRSMLDQEFAKRGLPRMTYPDAMEAYEEGLTPYREAEQAEVRYWQELRL